MRDLYPIRPHTDRSQNCDQMLRTGQVTTRLHLFVWFWRVGDGVRDQWLGTEGNVSSLKTSSARLSVAAASCWSLSEVRFLPGTWPGGAQCCSFSLPATFLHQTLERGDSWATVGAPHGPGYLSRSQVAACLCREEGVTGLELQANNPTPHTPQCRAETPGGTQGHHSLYKPGDLNIKYKK